MRSYILWSITSDRIQKMHTLPNDIMEIIRSKFNFLKLLKGTFSQQI